MRPTRSAILRTDCPMLLDKMFNDIQQHLIDNVDWLDLAYGQAERIMQRTEKFERTYIPAYFMQGEDYENLLPDDRKGNYSFFTVDDNQSIEGAKGRPARISGTCNLIVWLNVRTITNGWGKEQAKNAILNALTALNLSYGHLQVTNIFERAEAVFSGFTLEEVENQYMTYPFCGFRFVCDYTIRQDCHETGGARVWPY